MKELLVSVNTGTYTGALWEKSRKFYSSKCLSYFHGNSFYIYVSSFRDKPMARFLNIWSKGPKYHLSKIKQKINIYDKWIFIHYIVHKIMKNICWWVVRSKCHLHSSNKNFTFFWLKWQNKAKVTVMDINEK